MKKITALFIYLYQVMFSPDQGVLRTLYLVPNRTCVFYPTCSEYAKKSIQKHGFLKGSTLSLWRIMRCNPWQKNCIDLP